MYKNFLSWLVSGLLILAGLLAVYFYGYSEGAKVARLEGERKYNQFMWDLSSAHNESLKKEKTKLEKALKDLQIA